jgi:hypothetical protein
VLVEGDAMSCQTDTLMNAISSLWCLSLKTSAYFVVVYPVHVWAI